MRNPFASQPLTRGRIAMAIAVAGATDAFIIALGPIAWLPTDEILDVAAMIVISLVIGFHPLLLPTFILEALPFTESLPTWTACVGAVVLWRRSMNSPSPEAPTEQSHPSNSPDGKKPAEPTGPIIDV